MASYLITYDLNSPGQNYNDLYTVIKGLGTWWHCLDSTWIIKSNLTAVQIRDSLSAKIDKNDSLLVASISSAAWKGFSADCSDWLKKNL